MPIRLELPSTLGDRLEASDRPLIGLWACAGSPITAELMASSGCDWVLLDAEHSPTASSRCSLSSTPCRRIRWRPSCDRRWATP